MSSSSNEGSTVSSKKNDDSVKEVKKRKNDLDESSKSTKDKDKEKEKPKKDKKEEDSSRRKEKEKNHNDSKHSDDENDKDPKEKSTKEKPSPFDTGLEPDKIIGATDINGELAFLVQWKNSNKAMLIPSKLARQRCPQLVIDFYEQRLAWHTD